MTDPATPNPADVQRGEAALTTALRISTLLPGEQDAIFSILHSLNTADEWLPHLAGQPNSDAYAMRLLATIVTTTGGSWPTSAANRLEAAARNPGRDGQRHLRTVGLLLLKGVEHAGCLGEW
jgi:hypothetical protein